MSPFLNELTPAAVKKDLGAVFTPDQVVDFLVRWAIRSKDDIVIDPGAGEGAFITAAFNQLRTLGAKPVAASKQIYGAEHYKGHFEELTKAVRERTGFSLPNLRHADLFDMQFPQADAVIGNPPYVIRHRLHDSQKIRLKVSIRAGQALRKQQSDLYAYFVMYTGSFLKEGGRLALILSDSWLDMDFGIELKTFLLRNFGVHAVISFDKRVFPEALVKTVVLLAERTSAPKAGHPVQFIRIKRPGVLPEIQHYLSANQTRNNGLKITVVPQDTLDPRQYWSIYLKAPELYFQLSNHPLFTTLGDLAHTRIGLQTLAKKFYILPKTTLDELNLEHRFFEPIAVSPRDIATPLLDEATPLEHYVLLCARPKSELRGMNLLKYIEASERSPVEIKTLHTHAEGYHKLPRLQRAGRDPWYDLKTETTRRGRYPILLPRRVYQNFSVIWNKRGVIPNEDFLEAKPKFDGDLFALLTLLNSSFGEFMIRSVGHIYGGGVCNLNPNDLKILPILNVGLLDAARRGALTKAFQPFVDTQGKDQAVLDRPIFTILGESGPSCDDFYAALDELRSLSTTLKTT